MQQLEFEAAKIKAEKEELVLETALAESKAKLRVLKEYERSEDGLSSYSAVQKSQGGHMKERTSILLPQQANTNTHVQPHTQHSRIQQQSQPVFNYVSNAQSNSRDDIIAVMQKQNVITELLVKQQQLSHLPTKDIPVFEGDALQYKSFNLRLVRSCAYIDKALKWPQVKSDDGKALSAYAMFLIGCRNTM